MNREIWHKPKNGIMHRSVDAGSAARDGAMLRFPIISPAAARTSAAESFVNEVSP